jgi:LysM repeat protein
VVEKGETLYRIAQRHGVTVAALMKANQIDDPAKLRVGQQLKLPGNAQPPQPPKNTIAARPPAPEPVKPKVAPTPEEEAVSKALETVASTASAPKPPVTQPASPPPSQEPVLSRQLAPLTSATPRPAPAAKQLQPTPPPRPPRGTALITHIVEINDSLEDLATHFGQTVDQILFENPRIRSNRDLRVGAPLKIRVPAKF